jgi:hypothetical protein
MGPTLGVATILLIVSTQDASDPALSSVRSAVAQSLSWDADLVIENRVTLPIDAEADALAADVHAAMVGELHWEGATRERAILHVHVDHQPEWVDRTIDFQRADAPAERGRAIGVVLAAMLPNAGAASAGAAPTTAPGLPVVPSALPPVPPSPTRPGETDQARLHDRSLSTERQPRVGLGVSGMGSAGLGATNGDGGAAIDARWYAGSRVALRAVGELRFGTVSAAAATSLLAAAGIGAACRILGSTGHLTLAVRGDLLGSYLRLTRDGPRTGALMQEGRWLPLVDAGLEGAWPLTSRFALVAAVSGEAALGSTDVLVDGAVTARLAPFRLSGELGGRVDF